QHPLEAPGTRAVPARERLYRSRERRQAGCIAVGVAHREAIEQVVAGLRRPWARRRGADPGGRLLEDPVSTEAAGEDARRERFEVGLAREAGVERLETLGRREQQRGGVRA